MFFRGVIGMSLQTKGMTWMYNGIRENARQQPAQIGGRKKSGRPAAQVKLPDNRRPVHPLTVQFPLPDHRLQIFFLYFVIGGDLLITAAVDTKGFAKR